jgi:hypothetical protein
MKIRNNPLKISKKITKMKKIKRSLLNELKSS